MSRSARGSFSTMGSPSRPDVDLMVDRSPRVRSGSPAGGMSPGGGEGAYSPVEGSQEGRTPLTGDDSSGKGKGKGKKDRKDKEGNAKPSQRPSWRSVLVIIDSGLIRSWRWVLTSCRAITDLNHSCTVSCH